jgi:hypothetical protein
MYNVRNLARYFKNSYPSPSTSPRSPTAISGAAARSGRSEQEAASLLLNQHVLGQGPAELPGSSDSGESGGGAAAKRKENIRMVLMLVRRDLIILSILTGIIVCSSGIVSELQCKISLLALGGVPVDFYFLLIQ